MKKSIVCFVFILCANFATAQKITLDKDSGLVKADGVAAFYLVPNTVGFLKKDYILKNLQKEELAYLKATMVADYNSLDYSNQRKAAFLVTFHNTGNYCNITDIGMSVMKFLTKKIIAAKLVQNNRIDADAERKFIESNSGTIIKDPSEVIIHETVRTATITEVQKSNPSSVIQIKEKEIYSNGLLVGFYKKEAGTVVNSGVTKSTEVIHIYTKDETKVATALHYLNDDTADWEITIISNNKHFTVLYNNSAPLDRLFKYLVDKNFL